MAETKQVALPGYPELELSLIGAALMWPDNGPLIVSNALSEEDFVDSRCRYAFLAMKSLVSRGQICDVASIGAELTNKNWFQAVGGGQFLYDAVNSVFTDESELIEHHCKLIRSASIARKLIQECHRTYSSFSTTLANSKGGYEEFCESVRTSINSICDSIPTDALISSEQVANIALDEVKAAKASSSESGLIGVETGLIGLNKLTHGWKPGNLIIIGGKPSMGKSAFTIHSAYCAARAGNEIAYFTLEMTNEENMKRLLSNVSSIETDKMISGHTSPHELSQLDEAAATVGKAPIWFSDSLLDYEDIVATITRLKARRKDLKAVYIDYLGLMNLNQHGLSKDREIGIMTGGMKRLAKKLKISIILLCQVNRESGNDRPTLANLRDSGNIEQDADVVIFVHRPDYFAQMKEQQRISQAEIIVAKNRSGKLGTINARFDKAISHFSDIFGQH